MQRKTTVSTTRLVQRRDAWLAKLGQLGPMTRGSLGTARRGTHSAHQRTVSIQGKTHTVSVPPGIVEEVKRDGVPAESVWSAHARTSRS